MRKIILLFIFLSSCGRGEGEFIQLNSRSHSLSSKQKQALLPNPLFIALVDRRPDKFLKKIIDENGQYLLALNSYGDTALSLAIQFNNSEGALFIAKQLSPKHYTHTNHKGEGYIYLASRKGDVNLLKFLADKFYESQRELLSDYEFSDIDMKTHSGERALHTAKNYAVAEVLEYEYWRGSLEYPLRKFQYLQNNEGQSFLHTAVRDQNIDLLRYGLDHNCIGKQEWEDWPFYYRYPAVLWRGLQTYGKPLALDWDDLLNTQDKEGRTAVNFSAQTLFLKGIHIFVDCQWTDYLLPDNKGNIPLQNFLLALDSEQAEHEEGIKEAFTLLMERRTRLTWLGISDHVNSVNQEGESSLHISARMADSFFYNQLKKYGSVEQKNNSGQTPREILKSKTERLKQSGF